MASLMGLVESLPPGANAFDYIRTTLEDEVFTPPQGYFRFQLFLFIAMHGL